MYVDLESSMLDIRIPMTRSPVSALEWLTISHSWCSGISEILVPYAGNEHYDHVYSATRREV